MKRSEINAIIAAAEGFMREQNFALPPWAAWGPGEWAKAGADCDEIRNCRLGWDITDFGSGNFAECGLLLFTLRNGDPADPKATKPYAEKVMVVRENQLTPTHYHGKKVEDIINRGGGELVAQVWMSDDEDNPTDADFTIKVDGVARPVGSGEILRLKHGQSVTLPVRCYHQFWAEGGQCLVGEVSMVNDDVNDNHFLEPAGRFPKILEDEPPRRLLCTEYPPAPPK
jgi:D-lyxose ketol-isomerase